MAGSVSKRATSLVSFVAAQCSDLSAAQCCVAGVKPHKCVV